MRVPRVLGRVSSLRSAESGPGPGGGGVPRKRVHQIDYAVRSSIALSAFPCTLSLLFPLVLAVYSNNTLSIQLNLLEFQSSAHARSDDTVPNTQQRLVAYRG